MNAPPSKRLRGLNQDCDPFGDEEEFTQDDLEELDILASQAATAAAEGLGSRPWDPAPGPKPRNPAWGPSPPLARGVDKPVGLSGESSHEWNRRPGQPGNAQQDIGSDRDHAVRLLETQQAELKRKLKEVEEEILLKNGEIRVLRDSLRAAQQENEAQRQNRVLLETQRQREQSERERELSRKVQSLQAELHFKEAEIHDMKTKLLSSDKNRTASPLAVNSSKDKDGLAAVHHGSSSSFPLGNGLFPKQTSALQTSSRMTAVQSPLKANSCDGPACSSRWADAQEPSRPDPFLNIKPAHAQHRGGVLLGLLLQKPLTPGTFDLSDLLALRVEDSSRLLEDFQLCSNLRPAVIAGEAGSPRVPRSLVQSLAATGLSVLSQSPQAASSRACPGAVLLLPLLDMYLSELSQTPASLRFFCWDSSSAAIGSHLAGCAGKMRLEEAALCDVSVADAGLTALRLLRVLLTHSDEVVQAVLLKENPRTQVVQAVLLQENPRTQAHHATVLCSQNAVLQSLVRLCESSSQKEELIHSVMETLCVLIDRTPQEHSERLQCVLQAVCTCVCTDRPVQTLSHGVSVLTSLSEHQILAKQLCSLHDPCVFLKLFHFLRTRPDKKAAQSDWTVLDLQVVTLVSRLTQGAGTWRADVQHTCQCSTQLVQTAVVLLHRQWLDLRCSQESAEPADSCWTRSVALSLLRECLLLLHWLLLHHSSFSESCRPLLHMYDQMIPAMRSNLRNILQLSESEDVALEDLCRSEGDDADEMDADG